MGGQFKPGTSGNPGGRPSIAKMHERAVAEDPDLAELAGLTIEQARAKWYAVLAKVALAGPRGPKDSNWTYASGEFGARICGKAPDHLTVEGPTIDAAVLAHYEALRLTPHERRLAAQDTTAAEDDAAMDELVADPQG